MEYTIHNLTVDVGRATLRQVHYVYNRNAQAA